MHAGPWDSGYLSSVVANLGYNWILRRFIIMISEKYLLWNGPLGHILFEQTVKVENLRNTMNIKFPQTLLYKLHHFAQIKN